MKLGSETDTVAGKTFQQILAETRLDAARAAWHKAAVAGNLRHAAVAEGNQQTAQVCGAAKDRHMLRAMQLAGDWIRVVDATDYARCLSVCFRGERVGSLHIPKDRLPEAEKETIGGTP